MEWINIIVGAIGLVSKLNTMDSGEEPEGGSVAAVYNKKSSADEEYQEQVVFRRRSI